MSSNDAREFLDAIRNFHPKNGEGKYYADLPSMQDARALAEGMRDKFVTLLDIDRQDAWEYVFQNNTRVFFNIEGIVVPEKEDALEIELSECEVEESIEGDFQ